MDSVGTDVHFTGSQGKKSSLLPTAFSVQILWTGTEKSLKVMIFQAEVNNNIKEWMNKQQDRHLPSTAPRLFKFTNKNSH